MATSEVDETAEAIMKYLEQHPDAADTAGGIQRWWLSSEIHEVSIETVLMALYRLEKRGKVVANEVRGGPVIYSRPRRR